MKEKLYKALPKIALKLGVKQPKKHGNWWIYRTENLKIAYDDYVYNGEIAVKENGEWKLVFDVHAGRIVKFEPGDWVDKVLALHQEVESITYRFLEPIRIGEKHVYWKLPGSFKEFKTTKEEAKALDNALSKFFDSIASDSIHVHVVEYEGKSYCSPAYRKELVELLSTAKSFLGKHFHDFMEELAKTTGTVKIVVSITS